MGQRIVVAILVKDGLVLNYATNEHKESCRRIGYPTGVGYELCDGCNYPNHAEVKVLDYPNTEGATLYLIGHYYACDKCLEAIQKTKVNLVIL